MAVGGASAGGALGCSHRGPLLFQAGPDGGLQPALAPGGMVQAIRPALTRLGGRWVMAAVSDEDRRAARARPLGWDDGNVVMQMLDLPREAHRDHYEVVSVDVLGRLFHCLFRLPDMPVFDRRFWTAWDGFLEVCRCYARAVLAAPEAGPVLVQDFHLLAVAQAVRAATPWTRPLLYFHHVPWCDPEYLTLLPTRLADDLLALLLAHDVVAFNARRWALNFLLCCRRRGVGTVVGEDVSWQGRRVRVRSWPAPVDVPAARAEADGPPARRWLERFDRERAGRWALVRVDRVDPWKNVVRGFEAFDALLERRPDLAGRIWFLAVLTPTRTWSADHREYLARTLAAARRVNERHQGRTGDLGPPVTVELAADGGVDRARALGALRVADAVLVSSFFDGLNLVAKEAAAVGDRDPVLLLSRNAGAIEQLHRAALPIDPCDVVGMAGEMERAYLMTADDRARRAEVARAVVEAESPASWIHSQLAAARD